jgi:hypothetical protein
MQTVDERCAPIFNTEQIFPDYELPDQTSRIGDPGY